MIQAKVIADSLSPMGDRLTTLEVVFPRYILAEGKTHRIISGMLEQFSIETSVGLNDEKLLSKNSASSRAIPFRKMIKEVENNPFIPYAFQRDHSGMQGTEYITDADEIKEAEEAWLKARDLAVSSARLLNEGLGISKQLANRLLEPFLYHKVLISATEWENFFNLRCPRYTTPNGIFKSRKDVIKSLQSSDSKTFQCYSCEDILDWLKINQGQADIHMMFLAEAIYDAIQESRPIKLKEGDWHIPYSSSIVGIEINKEMEKLMNLPSIDIIENRVKISIARCARLSYQTLGDNPVIDYEKDLQLYEVLSKSGHWSPFEHVARVMTEQEYKYYIKGKCDNKGEEEFPFAVINESSQGWCRNFRGFIQQRSLID